MTRASAAQSPRRGRPQQALGGQEAVTLLESEVPMKSFFRTIPVEEATGKVKELYDDDLKRHGRVRGATQMLSLRPEVSAAWRALDGALQSTLEPRHYELAPLAAAVGVRCSA
jgi:hypothetical protein